LIGDGRHVKQPHQGRDKRQMAVESLVAGQSDPEQPWSAQKVTIKELASKLGISVPTLRKYGECGLLDVDSVSGRTNLFDEASAIARVEEINRLKSRGYSLSLIRQKLEERPVGFMPLELGLTGPEFSAGRHVLAVMQDMDEYIAFARSYIGNALRGSQACVLMVHPDHRMMFEKIISEEGFDLDHLLKRRQLCFTWFEAENRAGWDRQIEQYDGLLGMILAAGWKSVRMLGHPETDGMCFDHESVAYYEERLTLWARQFPIIVVCASLASGMQSRDLLHHQKAHREFVLGNNFYLQP